MGLKGQHAVVMGGTSGMGLATAAQLVAHGAEVTVTGRSPERLAAAREEAGVNAVQVDASSATEVREFFGGLERLDHLVIALSGGKGGGPFATLDLADLRSGFEGKFWPQLLTAQASLDVLAADGSITFLTSISTRNPDPGTAGLAAINAALEAMVPALAVELAPRRVNAISPGVIDTPWWSFLPDADRQATFADYAARTPAGRVGQAADVAGLARLLAENTFMTGTVIPCDGGLHHT